MKKQQPNSIEVEKLVLGAILLEPDAMFTVAKMLKPKYFFDGNHQRFYKAMTELYSQNLSIDAVVVFETLKQLELSRDGDVKLLMQLQSAAVSAAKTELHCRIIIEKWMLRELTDTLDKLKNKALKEVDDSFELIGEGINSLEQILAVSEMQIEEENFYDRLPKLFSEIENERQSNVSRGIKTHYFPSFDYYTDGLQEGNLVVISGKYKSGKSRLAMALALDYTVQKIETAIIGFEMNDIEYMKNIVSMATGVRYGYLRDPSSKAPDGSYLLTKDHIYQMKNKCESMFWETKLFISDSVFNDTDIAAKIKYWKKKYGIKVVFIDYLQLIESNKRYERKNLEIADISKMFKNIARLEKLTIFILVQENESGEAAESKGPLRDSDFWFSISHPVDEKKESIKVNGVDVPVDQSTFWVKLKASRHTKNGGSFVCKFFDNGEFKEQSLDEYKYAQII